MSRQQYDQLAPNYDRAMRSLERLFLAEKRRAVWNEVRGERILELGVGTGINIPHYPRNAHVVAVDFSPGMLEVARRRAQEDGAQVQLLLTDVQELSFADASFDSAVSTCLFCSVEDPIRGLREIRRVLRPDGRLVMLEHVRGPEPLGTVMDLLEHIFGRSGFDHINRRTVETVRHAGFEILDVRSYALGVLRLIVARPTPGARPGHLSGIGG